MTQRTRERSERARIQAEPPKFQRQLTPETPETAEAAGRAAAGCAVTDKPHKNGPPEQTTEVTSVAGNAGDNAMFKGLQD